jgi:hypothetical protein
MQQYIPSIIVAFISFAVVALTIFEFFIFVDVAFVGVFSSLERISFSSSFSCFSFYQLIKKILL